MPMTWNRLLAPIRFGLDQATAQLGDTRTHFQRDYDRVIFSSPFRRMQNKTQVFPLPGSVFVHNRLTHSLEVASVGRSLGNNIIPLVLASQGDADPRLVEQIPTIVSTACLAHDLGNPPFGHSGEEAIRTFLQTHLHRLAPGLAPGQLHDLLRFEGNANGLRLLTQSLQGRREGGFRLSFPALSAMVKYPWESTWEAGKFGLFQTEREPYHQMADALGIPRVSPQPLAFARHPLVYLVEAADDICYQVMDIEDAHKLGILPTPLVQELLLGFFDPQHDAPTLKKMADTLDEVSDPNEQIAFLRALTIGKLTRECTRAFGDSYADILEGRPVPPLIEQLEPHGAQALRRLKRIALEQVYNHRTVVEIELAGFKILGSLLESFCQAMLNPAERYSVKVQKLMPAQFAPQGDSTYLKLMAVVDYVSGMTDVFALEMYRTLQGISIPGISK